MTRVEVAAGRAGPTEMPGNGARRAKADGIFDEADAGFMAQLTSLTVEEEAGGSTPHSKDAMKAVLARWWQQRSAGAQASLPAEADGEASDAPTADVAALLTGQVDAQVGVDVVPTAGPRSSEDKPARAKEDGRWHAQPHAQPSDAGPPTGALPSILAAAPTVHANAEPGQVPARPLPAAAPSASG